MPTSAAGGRVRSAGSMMTRQAANGTPCRAAILAAMWDSMSTATVPADWCSAALVAPRHDRSVDAGNVGINRLRQRLSSRCDQRLSVGMRMPSATTPEAITQSPGASPGASPPAMPMLMMPLPPASTADFKLVDVALGGAAEHVNARPGRDLGLERQACDGDDRIDYSRRGSFEQARPRSGIASAAPNPSPR